MSIPMKRAKRRHQRARNRMHLPAWQTRQLTVRPRFDLSYFRSAIRLRIAGIAFGELAQQMHGLGDSAAAATAYIRAATNNRQEDQ